MPPAASAAPISPRRASSGLLRILPANLVRFGLVGCAGLVTDASLFFLMAAYGLPEPIARAISLGLATIVTWRLNRRFTFGDSARAEAFEGGWYGLVALCAQGLNYLLFLALRAALPDTPALVALLVAAAFAALFSYTGQRFVTFRGRIRS